ncbi:MAG: AAA family ATPase [Magnetococcales bacterium]|nr:AAA family ATPase [Magnetococcales bacterium]
MDAAKSPTPASPRTADLRQSGRRPQFFAAKSHASIWRVLRAGLLRAEGVILVTGVEGSGKSSLIKRLPGMIPDNRDLAMIQSADLPDAEFLHQLIFATALTQGDGGSLAPVEPLSPDDPDDSAVHQPALTLQDLVDAMEERVAMGRKLVLVVDQAHALRGEPLAWLDMMVRFVSEGIKPVQLLLAGRPELRAVLESETGRSLADQIVGSCEVTPLTRGEVWDYLSFQLEKAMGGSIRVSWFAWMEVYAYSRGLPLRIDQLLKRILPLVKQRNAKKVTRSMVRIARSTTTGRIPMEREAAFVSATLPARSAKARIALFVGGVTVLAGVGYLSGLFDSSTASSEKTEAANKAETGEGSAYVRLFQPEVGSAVNPAKPDKSAAVKEGSKSPEKPTEEKSDEKSGAPKKRYWEPNMPIRPDGPMPIPERAEPGLSALARPASEPLAVNRATPDADPESFRKRYQSAKAMSSTAPAGGGEGAQTETSESLLAAELKKGAPPVTPLAVRNARPVPIADPVVLPSKPVADSGASRGSTGEGEDPTAVKVREAVRKPPPMPPVPAAPPPANTARMIAAAGEGLMVERAAREPEKPVKPAKSAVKTTAHAGDNAPLPHISGVATEKSFRALGKVYVVQIGSYSTQDSADQLKRTLSGSGRDPYVHLSQKKNRRLYSVRMNYRAREAAERMAQTIQQQEGLSVKVMELNYD